MAAGDIDAYEHVNNSVYMTWFDRAAWDHSAALGLPIEKCLELDRGMAVLRSVIAYLRPALLGDTVEVATWILPMEGNLRIRRRFQVLRAVDGTTPVAATTPIDGTTPVDGRTLARADIEYACIALTSGRPARWPEEFRTRYVAIEEVVRAAEGLAPV